MHSHCSSHSLLYEVRESTHSRMKTANMNKKADVMDPFNKHNKLIATFYYVYFREENKFDK